MIPSILRRRWRSSFRARSQVLPGLGLALLIAGCRLATPTAGLEPEVTPDATPMAEALPSEMPTGQPIDLGRTDSTGTDDGQPAVLAAGTPLSRPGPLLHFPRVEQRRPAPVADAPATGTTAVAPPAGPTAIPPVPGAARPDCPGIAVRQGRSLAIDGQSFVFFGLNAPFLLDDGFPEGEIDPLLAQLSARGVNALRVWFFHDEDPDRLARLLDAGSRHGIRFIVTMADAVHKGIDWFHGTEDEERSVPHIHRTVERFKDRPEILMWEPVNEPNCGDGRYDDECLETIRAWLGTIAEEIKAIDGCRVVSTSYIGAGNFDSELDHYRTLHGKDAIEILSVHKRSTDEAEDELEAADDRERPIFYGEIYDIAYDDGCQPLSGKDSVDARAERVKDDLRQAIEDGVDGYLLWELAIGRVEMENGDTRHVCSRFGFELKDPLWEKLRSSDPPLPPPVPWR